ncbi:hypothetical protein COCSUDRAFT_34454 [Coccomyxa subellipsoidea C-169]|uniref:Uncharacterized protein n=1 Tax=Coccomyxa subellipsoidea (strain C-169) TaxID=574566 RepID=I0YJR9_COCSC|nr:hypothetical protein COCSUDRAFT_34454 [Coccomyxa subellipsoidea C-169]EIE18638.1 hypothetical protein COCSUDRAFT_34454 [Coccomyxa subellipsoidea C-169]|eukprot:XP_005643182.1 hypothetical protein COCSUDRAFT_34454 [Coccomyxa subellipsoidea C-169]
MISTGPCQRGSVLWAESCAIWSIVGKFGMAVPLVLHVEFLALLQRACYYNALFNM